MFTNFLKVTFRNLVKNQGYFTINLLGLTLGVTCALLIFVVIRYEMSYDGFHTKKDRIYRVIQSRVGNDGAEELSEASTYPLAAAMRNDFPDLERVTIVRYDGQESLISIKDDLKNTENKFAEAGVAFVEPDFFDIFDFPMLQGRAKTAIKEPNMAIISEKIAQKYFGNEPAIGKVIRWDGRFDFKVEGVFKDFPSNTDFPFQVVLSYATMSQIEEQNALTTWGSMLSSLETFVLLPEKTTRAQAERHFSAFEKKYLTEEDDKRRNYALQSLADIHFDNRTYNFSARVASIKNLWALALIGVFLVLTACINFINLATAQAVKRSKEVGIRKVLGSSRLSLVSQFMGETLVITSLGVGLAFLAARLLLPQVNSLLGIKIEDGFLLNQEVAIFLTGLTLIVALLSGFYPALVLSGFKAIVAIKNAITANHTGGMNLRRGLIIMQFTLSQLLITCTLIAIQQMDYFQNKDMGFNKEAVLTVGLPRQDSLRFETLKSELKRLGEVQKVSLSFTPPVSESSWITGMQFLERNDESINVNMRVGDADYIDFYDLKLLAGRNIIPSDSVRELVVNERMVRQMGLKSPQEAIGKILTMGRRQRNLEIVGVIKDFHLYSLQSDISPCAITTSRSFYRTANIKLSANNMTAALPKIEKIWTSVFPEYVYSYRFLDQQIAGFYEAEERQANLFKLFALIAIFIGCIGLYGLVSFMATQKTKEVGIRKVLGASVNQIILIFSKEFGKLLLASFVIASPIVYYVMKAWLENFTYRIDLSMGVFAIAILVSALIATLTVGYKSINAALINPVKSLRSE